MAQDGLTRKDLEPLIGTPARDGDPASHAYLSWLSLLPLRLIPDATVRPSRAD